MNLNQAVCANKWGNTGALACSLDPEQIEGVIILPDSVSFNIASYASDALFLAALAAATLVAPTSRIRPYLYGIDFTDETGDPEMNMKGFGKSNGVTHMKPAYTMTVKRGGLGLIQELAKMEGNTGLSFMFYDKTRKLYGKLSAAGYLKGWAGDLSAMFKHAVGNDHSTKMLKIYLHDEKAFIDPIATGVWAFDAGVYLQDEISGVHPVKLTLVSASTSAIVIKCVKAQNDEPMGDSYEASLEQASAFSLVLNSTGAAVTITSVTYSATAKTLTLAGTFTTAPHTLSMASTAALAALTPPCGSGVTGGFESNVITVTPA